MNISVKVIYKSMMSDNIENFHRQQLKLKIYHKCDLNLISFVLKI